MSLPARASIARRTLFAFAAALAAASCATASPSDDFFRAVISDNPGAVERLLKQGFDPNGRDPKGQTGLLLALREPSPRVAKVLIASPRVNVDATNASDETPLMMAALKGQQEYVDLLLARDAAVNKPGWAPLHYAATNGHISIMKQLLEQHAFIDAQSPNGTTPLMMAAMYGSAEAVKLLLDEGADIAMKNQLGMTALDFAKRGNRPDAVEMLTRAQQLKPRPAGAGKW
ncbi:ankyrin repeat domain-containing protein [Pseudacidovorax intermedius]|uniref:ankyrin repeat domain-containing protein n=1 Tax=Pseudacidovorax intermedius TaxID=433924 RepID=UPI0026EF871A|nr:ankyrin repeat domain-containing protein [Pseudacidovorax intermedius]